MPDPLMDALPLDPNDPRIKAMGLGIRAPQLLRPLADLAKPQPPPEASKSIFAVNPVSAAVPTPAPKPLSQQYAELQGQEPKRSDPQYKVPGWKQALGLTFATLGGIGNPGRASELAEGVLHGPYNRAEQDWRNKGLAIEQQSKIGDTESQMREREAKATDLQNKPDKVLTPDQDTYNSLIKQGKTPQEALEIIKSSGKADPNRTPESQTYDSLIKQGKSPQEAYEIVKGTGKAEKSTKEQIQQQINAEMSKPNPDAKVIKGLQSRLTAIDPLSEERLRDAESRSANAQERSAEAGRQFHPAIAQQVVQGMTTQESTRRLLQILEPYKNDNTPFGSFLKTMEYKLGRAQTDEIGQQLASINLTSLQQAGTVLKGMGGVRSAVVLDKVLQHTPDSTKDSVKLMYDKLINIDRATAIFLDDADKYGRKGGAELPQGSTKPYVSGGGEKTYTDQEVQAAAKAHGMKPEDIEKAYQQKGYKKKK